MFLHPIVTKINGTLMHGVETVAFLSAIELAKLLYEVFHVRIKKEEKTDKLGMETACVRQNLKINYKFG